MSDVVIETHGLQRRFGATWAVQDLSLQVGRGEVFGFLGPNGAGKTTSLKMLLGLVAPSAGRGTVLGAPLGDRRTRARLGFLPEHFRFQDWLTGRELLETHGRLCGLRGPDLDHRIDGLLARVDLADAAERPIRTYSKGMTQRIGLAQALVHDPAIVFLDEPTSGLDPLGRMLVRDIIRERRAAGVTVFLNSHLLGEVEATCDRVVFVQAGRRVHELALGADRGLEVELRVGPLDAAALAALAALATLDGPPEALDGGGATGGARTRLRLRVDDETALPRLAQALVERGVALYELKPARKPLEAWFVEVMGDAQRPG